MRLRLRRAGNLHVQHFQVQIPEQPQHIVQAGLVTVLHIEVHLRGVVQHPVLQLGQEHLRRQNQRRGEDAALVEPAAQAQAHNGRRPEARRRSEPLHPAAPGDDDGACADEANARHHLGSQPGHVRVVMEVQIKELAGEGRHGRPQADQDMGAEPRRPALVLPLQPDETAAHHRQQHPQRGGQHGHIPHTVKNRQQSPHLPQISSMV